MSRKDELLPILVATFAELGYRRATTSALARRCQVQETILYRIWPDKKSMFVDAIDYVADNNLRIYREVMEHAAGSGNPAEALLAYESRHIGEFHNYRIVFAALSETSDPDIQHALQRAYRRIHTFLVEVVARHTADTGVNAGPVSWGLIGVGTIMTILDDLGLMEGRERAEVIRQIGMLLLQGDESKH